MAGGELKRTLGFWQTFATGVGLVVASSSLVTLGNGFGLGGPAFIIPAFAACVISILIALSYAELANMIPGAGMVGDYTAPALGRLPAVFAVLGGYVVLAFAAGAAESLVAGVSINGLVPAAPPVLVAGAIIIVFFVVNMLGVELFGKTQVLLTSVLMATIAVLGVVGLLGLGGGTPVSGLTFNPGGWMQLSQLVALGIWLYIGIEFVCPMSEEIRNPERNIARAMIIGLVVIFVADMLFGLAMVRYTDAGALASSTTPHVVGAEGIAGNFGLVWVSAMTLLAAASSIDTLIAAIPRMLYGLAREGMLPRIFAYVNPRFRTPWVAICAVTLLIAAPLALAITIDTIITLILIAAVTWLVSYIIAQVDVIVLRRKYPDARRPFKTPFYPVPQVLGIAACVYMIFSVHPDPATRNTIWLFAGLSALVILVYAVVWLKFVKKMTLFTPVPLDEELKIIREHSEPIESEPVDARTTRGAKS